MHSRMGLHDMSILHCRVMCSHETDWSNTTEAEWPRITTANWSATVDVIIGWSELLQCPPSNGRFPVFHQPYYIVEQGVAIVLPMVISHISVDKSSNASIRSESLWLVIVRFGAFMVEYLSFGIYTVIPFALNGREFARTIILIELGLQRNCMHKHDFIAALRKCFQRCVVVASWVIKLNTIAYICHWTCLVMVNIHRGVLYLCSRWRGGEYSGNNPKCRACSLDEEALGALQPVNQEHALGGGIRRRKSTFGGRALSDYIRDPNGLKEPQLKSQFLYLYQCEQARVSDILRLNHDFISAEIPLDLLVQSLTKSQIISLSKHHVGCWIGTRDSAASAHQVIRQHACINCPQLVSVLQCREFQKVGDANETVGIRRTVENRVAYFKKKLRKVQVLHSCARRKWVAKHSRDSAALFRARQRLAHKLHEGLMFPPPPRTRNDEHRIISAYCHAIRPSVFVEGGCAVCGCLKPIKQLTKLADFKGNLDVLVAEGVTRRERVRSDDPEEDIPGPVLDNTCDNICVECEIDISGKKVPRNSLARNRWVGNVPTELRDLSYAESVMIAKVRHSICVVRVASGRVKMTANVIMFTQPIMKIYQRLPPSKDELSEILAFVFTGSSAPTQEDFERTPMLVRRQKVAAALNWLKLNHTGYRDLDISQENLDSYPDSGIPVAVDYRHVGEDDHDLAPADTVGTEDHASREHGTSAGPCTYAVHGLSGSEYETATMETIKSVALRHLTEGGRMLGIGRSELPVTMYDNVNSYPAMFPWLFPYGLGGPGHPSHHHKLGELSVKKSLLLYHDKRFQRDVYFPMLAFNHEQLKSASVASTTLAKKPRFDAIARRIGHIDPAVISSIADRLVAGERVKPINAEEKLCFDVIYDLDSVNYRLSGSLTSKKWMRNEIWSMISFMGAPTWFITISWADKNHPISLYYAKNGTTYSPDILGEDERNYLISRNPVAAARFFHFMVECFIKHVLCWDSEDPGWFGHSKGYYGTVEQQGRLTLHLHLLLWIENALSPQDIRDRIMDKSSAFRVKLIDYLESVYQGQFSTGSMEEIRAQVPVLNRKNKNPVLVGAEIYNAPTQTLPTMPPPECKSTGCRDCSRCRKLDDWWRKYDFDVDDLLLRSNVHDCKKLSAEDQKADDAKKAWRRPDQPTKPVTNKKTKYRRKGCTNRDGICRARFPRTVFPVTQVDEISGHVDMKKLEPMMNTFTPVITFLNRCNSDVTSLLSGTSIKAVVSYVSDYVAKLSLKTYHVFASVFDVFTAETDITGGTVPSRENARHIIRKIVNSLSTKMEIGSPMASMYLLGNPDHYTSHKFVIFWWRSYVGHVSRYWQIEEEDFDEESAPPETVQLKKQDGKIIATVDIDDYSLRPRVYESLNLYEWIQASEKKARTKNERLEFLDQLREQNYLIKLPKMRDTDDISMDGVDNSGEDTDAEDEMDLDSESGLDSDFIEHDVEDGDVDDYSYADDWDDNDWETDEEDSVILDKEKNKQNDSKDIWHPFLFSHPLIKSHAVRCDFARFDTHIPNFVGGTLPRSDKGDRQYYCITMLTLFKPWRRPADLKLPGISWESTFLDHPFTEKQRILITHFNVRYECNDARDDYFATMKRKLEGSQAPFPSQFGHIYMGEKDDFSNDVRGFEHGLEDDTRTDSMFDEIGRRTNKISQDQEIAGDLLRSVGWLKNCVDTLPDTDLERITPVSKTRLAWSNTVKGLREKYLVNKLANMPPMPCDRGGKNKSFNQVGILPSDYFNKRFKASTVEAQAIIDDVSTHFNLNCEQDRAFRLLANHASTPQSEPLRMYIAGMGGTGKSRVFEAIVRFFSLRNEDFRYLILGPTGSTAALVNGSTYHSVFHIPRSKKDTNSDDLGGFRNEAAMIAAVNDRIQGVEYILLDEISMVSCSDLQLLASQAAKARNVHDSPFGGLNTIFAGDFAQLPPTTGHSLYYGGVGLNGADMVMSHKEQNSVLGRILWHQITTVVVLRVNMRLQGKTPEDVQLKIALENMRYGACTPADLQFLRSRTVGNDPMAPVLNCARFCHASIITAHNVQKDAFNKSGAIKFARDTGQELTHFRSVDKLSAQAVDKMRWKNSPQSTVRSITQVLRSQLWNATPSTSDHVAGTLSLCIGMPVMLRSNDATELCITKGQEAMVVGWDSSIGPNGEDILDTLFVKLKKPPKDIQIDDLPLNVVPLPRVSKHVTCLLSDDSLLSIMREQVSVLLNFAMTDYGSQGKSRPDNPVDLRNCATHLSCYVALSRGTSAAGTVIIQGVDMKRVTSGTTGYLRQELREIEILDEITCLRFEGRLPRTVTGLYRRTLLRSFQLWKGEHYEVSGIHPAIRWQSDMGPKIPEHIEYSNWTATATARKPPAPTIKAGQMLKRPLESEEPQGRKKSKTGPSASQINYPKPSVPVGFKWDHVNYSCAYDALFGIICNIWLDNIVVRAAQFNSMSTHMSALAQGFDRVLRGRATLEAVRDEIRRDLHTLQPIVFPYGTNGTSVDQLVTSMLQPDHTYGRISTQCVRCKYVLGGFETFLAHISVTMGSLAPGPSRNISLATWFKNHLQRKSQMCPKCLSADRGHVRMTRTTTFKTLPPLLFVLLSDEHILLDSSLKLNCSGRKVTLKLRGIIYHGAAHFTSRLITPGGVAWFHDGITTGSTSILHGPVALIASLHHCDGRKAVAAVYALA